MERLYSRLLPTVNTNNTVPVTEFSDDKAQPLPRRTSTMSKSSATHALRCPTASMTGHRHPHHFRSRSAQMSSRLPPGTLRFFGSPIVLDQSLDVLRLTLNCAICNSSSNLRQMRYNSSTHHQCQIVQRSIAKPKSPRQITAERCHKRRSRDCPRLPARTSTPFSGQHICSTPDIT